MLLDTLYDILKLPKKGIVGKRVFKKLFHEKTKLTTADKKSFQEDLDNIIWQYTLKPDTVQLEAYTDKEREYQEIVVLQADLKLMRNVKRLADIIHSAIPYPLLLIMNYQDKFCLSIAPKRISLADKDTIVTEELLITDWFQKDNLEQIEKAFIHSLSLDSVIVTDLYQLYMYWAECFTSYQCAVLTDEYTVSNDPERRELLTECQELDSEIKRLQAEIKKEYRMQNKIDLNLTIKEKQQDYKSLTDKLK